MKEEKETKSASCIGFIFASACAIGLFFLIVHMSEQKSNLVKERDECQQEAREGPTTPECEEILKDYTREAQATNLLIILIVILFIMFSCGSLCTLCSTINMCYEDAKVVPTEDKEIMLEHV